jgi:hypothetical protein
MLLQLSTSKALLTLLAPRHVLKVSLEGLVPNPTQVELSAISVKT